MSTVRALFNHPGMLTREFLEGRRARYISPLRLYLMASLIYFLIAAAAPEITTEDGRAMFVGVRTTPTATARPEAVASKVGNAIQTQSPISAAERDSVLAEIDSAPRLMRPFIGRAVTDPVGFKRSVLEAMPKLLFALLPVFALIVAIFYRGRKYPEHLYFAVHLHAFIFLALAISSASKFPHSAKLAFVVGLACLTWILIYSVLAFRRTYGDGLAKTLVKGVAIAAIYATTSFGAFVVMLYAVSLRS